MNTIYKFYLLPLLFVPIFCMSAELRAESVQARYLENSGKRTVLELSVADPAPTSIIVKQRIPEGIAVQSAHPAYSKFSPGKREVKWLLKRPLSGVQRIVLNYSRSFSGKGASAVIRCKNPSDGSLMTITVQ